MPGPADLVDSLRLRFFCGSDVALRVEADRGLDPKFRQAAVELARRRGADIGKWNHEIRMILLDPNITGLDPNNPFWIEADGLMSGPLGGR